MVAEVDGKPPASVLRSFSSTFPGGTYRCDLVGRSGTAELFAGRTFVFTGQADYVCETRYTNGQTQTDVFPGGGQITGSFDHNGARLAFIVRYRGRDYVVEGSVSRGVITVGAMDPEGQSHTAVLKRSN